MIRSLSVILTIISICAPGLARAQDVAAGERVFKIQCATCHSMVKGKDGPGPSLYGVAGSGGPFESTEVLDRYLEAPKSVVRETTMPYPGLKNPQQRKDLIAYLMTFR